MAIVQIVILLILGVAICSLIKNKVLKIIVASLFSIFTTLQISSYYLTGTIADYKFYEHLRWDVLSNIYGEFLLETLFVILLCLALIYLIYYASIKLAVVTKKIIIPVAIVGFIALSLNNSIFANLYDSYNLQSANSLALTAALENLPVNAVSLKSSNITAQPGKNIIFLSLESFEKGFIEERPDLTPYLNKLKEKYHYYPLTSTTGGGWTSASAYMAMSGMPAFFGGDGNYIFQGSTDFKLNSLGEVLKTAGYDMTYLIANKEFSGMQDLLETFGFTVKSELDFTEQYKRIPWGLHDKDLFTELTKEIKNKKDSNKPFALYASSVSTHFPDGLYDKRMEELISPKNTDLEFMIAAVDYMIGTLFEMLEKDNLLENTTVILVPDHQFMAKHSAVNDLKERGLFLLSTDALPQSIKKPVEQLSMPKIVIELAGIETNAMFLSDIVNGNKNEFVENNKTQLRDINVAALTTTTIEDGFIIKIEDDVLVINLLNNPEVVAYSKPLDEKNGIISIAINDQYKLQDYFQLKAAQASAAIKTANSLSIEWTQSNGLKSFYTDADGITLYKNAKQKITYYKEEVLPKLDLLKEDTASLTDQVDQQEGNLELKSCSFNTKKLSYYKVENDQSIIDRGITIIAIDKNGALEAFTYDTYVNPEVIPGFIEKLENFKKQQREIFLVTHDTAGDKFANYKTELDNLGLKKLSGLHNRQAYVAHIKAGVINETIDDLIVKTNYNIAFKPKVLEVNSQSKIQTYSKDTDRFIAHAGGKIEGKIYTNSLEALDASYEKGFRIFELDIITTSDNQFIAAHDWNIWKEQTGYTGTTPVNLSEFKSHKLHNKFTPIAMQDINAWFSKHSDAVLVTDKIKDIKKFGNEFIDKSRLLMEVFSKKDAIIAQENNIQPILSENVMAALNQELVPFMLENNFKYLAFSRDSIEKFKEVLDEAAQHNIKSYVYHVNFKKGKDESYVVKYELGKVYGMYADQWTFK